MHLPNEIIFISGQRGSGKSFFAKNLSLSLPRCIIFDSLGEYQADERIFDISDFIDYLLHDRDYSSLFRLAFDSHDTEHTFPLFCRAVLGRGDLYVIIEEIDLFCNPYNTPPELAKLIKYGRHFGIQIVGVSRRPAEVSRLFTSQCSRFITFAQHEPNDIKYFRSLFGKHADQLPNLKPYHYMDVNFSGSPTYKIHSPIKIS